MKVMAKLHKNICVYNLSIKRKLSSEYVNRFNGFKVPMRIIAIRITRYI